MARPPWEVADVFRTHGAEYRQAHGSSLSCSQERVMEAIETCRTAALGGHIDACDQCGVVQTSYNSCRNRHCPKCQGLAKARWLEARLEELLPVEYFHVVFTLPRPLAALARQNPRCLYNLLFQKTAETLKTIAAEPKHLGAGVGFLAVLHTWGQTMSFHPHLHCVVPGGGFDPTGKRWISCRPGFFLPVRVLSRFFRRCFLQGLEAAYQRGELHFHGDLAELRDPRSFQRYLEPLRQDEWVVYVKPPFDGPRKVLDYLGRYTHRVAIANHRILDIRDGQVTFRWRDYRRGKRLRKMSLSAEEFIRRFLLHVLPDRLVRIRYFGFLAHRCRTQKIQKARQLLTGSSEIPAEANLGDKAERPTTTAADLRLCPECRKGQLVCIQTLSGLPRLSEIEGIDSS